MSRRHYFVLIFFLWLGLILYACDRGIPVDPGDLPVISHVQFAGNPNSVLSATATVYVRNAARVTIEYDSGSGSPIRTPLTLVNGDSTHIEILGLRPEKTYSMKAIAFSLSGNQVESANQPFTTSSLPADIPAFTLLSSSSPSSGYVMLGITSTASVPKNYALILDNEGKIVWYKKFSRPVADFQKQPSGSYTVFSSLDDAPPRFYEVDRSGSVLREASAAGLDETGPHELRFIGADLYLFGIEFRTMDLTLFGGSVAARVRGITILRHRGGPPLFTWSTFDHFLVSDAATDIPLTGASVNPWHGNALDIDTDGHLLVSFRNSDEITKINSTTGGIIWRMGGKNNQFTFLNDPFNGFSHQHGIRRLPTGHIILFDNGNLHSPPTSRAVEYSIDEAGKSMSLIWEYRGEPELYSAALGFAQRLPNGNTLICFGLAQRVVEVDMSGTRKWDLRLDDPLHYAYRAFRIDSLY